MTQTIKATDANKLDLSAYRKLLIMLRKKEQDMGYSPLLKDWFKIRN